MILHLFKQPNNDWIQYHIPGTISHQMITPSELIHEEKKKKKKKKEAFEINLPMPLSLSAVSSNFVDSPVVGLTSSSSLLANSDAKLSNRNFFSVVIVSYWR